MLAAFVLTGWLVLTGRVDWLARMAKPRIEQALRDTGIEADALDIARLSVGGGRIEHARVRFSGGFAEIHGLEVGLGVGNLTAGRAGSVTIDRLDVELSGKAPDHSGSEATTPGSISMPFDSVEIREWHVAVPVGGEVVHASGSLSATPEANGSVGFECDASTEGASGKFSGSYNPETGNGTVKFADLSVEPTGTLATVLKPLLESRTNAGMSFGWGAATAGGTVTISANQPARLEADAHVKHGFVSRRDERGELAELSVTVDWRKNGPLVLDAEGANLSGQSGEWKASAGTFQYVGGSDGGNVALGNAVFTSGEREVRGHGLGSFALGPDFEPVSAEGTVILDSALFDGIRAGESEIKFELKDGVLSAHAPGLGLTGAIAANIEDLKVSATNLTTAEPGVSGSAKVILETASFSRTGFTISPARERISTRFIGLLGAGRESLRVDFELEDHARTFEAGDVNIGAAGPLSGVVTIDTSHVSGSVAGEWRAVTIALSEGRKAAFPDVKFKWSTGRTWIEAVRNWADMDSGRVLRELLWISNIDVRTENGTADLGALGNATGVSATLVSNGTDISERAGGSLVVSAKSIHAADREFADLGATLGFGLDGGIVVADVSLARPRIPVHSRQELDWKGAFAMSGTYSTGTVDLAAAGPLGGLLPALKGITASGSLSAAGPVRLGPNGFAAGAHVELASVGVAWPDDKFTLAGVSGTLDLDSLLPLRAGGGQRLTLDSVKIQSLELTKATLEFGIPSPDSVEVTRLDATTLGGTLSATPFEFDLYDPRPATRVSLDGQRLDELLKFFPDVPATAEGRIVGEIPVAWDGQQVEFGTGYIDLKPGELGRVQFNYDIRTLTQGMKPRGVEYEVRRRVEKSIRDLYFNRLRIDLYPTASPGRSAAIKIGGATAGADVHAPVDLDINIDAPLERFLKWGTNPVKP